jgi:phthiocerol/phenolphthiocerol synthesis type-I polyketide synthase C
VSSSHNFQSPMSRVQRLPREPLAVIGIGCRLPGGIDSPAALWDALLRGVNAIRDVPDDRWKHERFHDTNPEKSGSIRNAKGGFIDGIDQFDGEFFGYFPTEAQRMDPQQRLLLEVTHEAMEDAGLRRDQLDGTRTSVFIGAFMYDYLCMQSAPEHRDEISPYVCMGTANCSLANRISYDFNLKGPSVSLDTACSSSLTALHLACQSVWGGEADMAIAGGVNLMLRPESSIMLSKGGFLNPDQYCKAFDESANGYVRGEGVGVVILKPLHKALADGDAIYARVHATGVNQDGYLPEGFTVPNVFSQAALLETVYAEAGIDPLTVDFVEAHGTGTSVGDPVESAAIGTVLGFDRSTEQPNLLIGSVKTNLGHLEGAAGIAGFIKGVLTAHHGVAPPNLHFHEPNPEILWEQYRLEVPTRPTPLPRNGRPLTVGVNSFGAGGANAHVVLQGPVDASADDPRQRRLVFHGDPCKTAFQGRPISADTNRTALEGRPTATLYALSSANRDSLRTLALRHADFLSETQQPLDDVAFSAFTRRSHYGHLLAVVGQTPKDVEDRLRKFAAGEVDPEILATAITRQKKPKLAFVFSGQGGQWARMGLELMRRETVFRDAIDQIDALFAQIAGWSLLDEIRKNEDESKINDTVVVQPAVMAIQIALVKLYEHYGIRPAGIVGHSIGEVAAGFAAGALTIEQAVEVIYHRSQCQDRVSGRGGMLAVGLTLEEARKLIHGHDDVSIGAVNGPQMLTLSGDSIPLQRIAETLESRGVFNRKVNVQVAYHSHHIDLIEDLMLEAVADVQGSEITTPLYSTVTGQEENGTHLNASYWFRNAREPVLFTDALSSMLDDGFDTFVEIGPHPVLVGGGEALIKHLDTDAIMAPSMTRREPEVTVFLQSLARLAARGFEPNVDMMFGSDRRYVRLPKHPWQHNRYWFESPAAAEMRHGRFEHPFLKRQTQMVTEDSLAIWEATLGVHKFPFLRDHQVDGEIVFPATGHMELAWAVASEQFRHESFFLENLHFDSPLILPDKSRHPLEVRLETISQEGDFRICSRRADAPAESPWAKHSSGRINTLHDRFEQSTVTLAELKEQFHDQDLESVEQFYENVREAGLAYGEKFRCIQQLQNHGHDWLAQIRLPDELLDEAQRNNIHPALFDACVHVLFADAHRIGHRDRLYLPYRIERMRFYRRPTQNVWAYVRITRNDEQYLNSDTLIFDEDGELVVELLGLVGKRLVGAGSHQSDSVYEGCYEYEWVPAARDPKLHGRLFDTTRAVIIAKPSCCFAVELADRFEAENIKPLIVPPSEELGFDELLADVPLDRRTSIVFAAGLPPNAMQADRLSDADWNGLEKCPAVPSLLQLAQTLLKREGVPNLFVVTNGAAGVDGDQHLDLSQAILHGMARVIRNECPQAPLTVVDLSTTIAPVEMDSLFHELLHRRLDCDETELALRGENRYVHQLVAVDRVGAAQRAATKEPGVGGAYRAELSVPGVLDQIEFRRLAPSRPEEDEVEIAVDAAALNFKDILNGMGVLSENAVAGGLTAHRLGLEVAGRVLRTGSLVKHVQIGDEVIARVAEGFRGRVTTPGHFVVRRPETLTHMQAAGVPLAYVTAWYSLCHLARIARNETVLIHSAAGGVGGAAIQLAQRAHATVIATAGTKEKREYLRRMGVEHVFDSRSLDFSNQVLEVTNKRGVDIVLNSLTGRFIAQSMKCLAPFGRFLELGKSDIYRDNKLSLERLGENISYFVVDVDRLAAQKPALHQQIMTEMVELFERGELQPHEITEFPIGKLSDAMKFMTRSNYHGKIVMNMKNECVHTLPPRNAAFRPDRSYLISGGASGFGLEVARWMASRGARHLVLMSRSGPKSDADRVAIDTLIEEGVCVLLAKADVTDTDAVRQLMDRIGREMPPLAGLIHSAAVMDDASIPAMTMERFNKVFSPKAQGAWNLHQASVAAGADLDFFLMFSSVSSVMGLLGQINYAPANYFLDALAVFRRQRGLSATSVNLGILGQYAGLSRSLNKGQDVIGLVESQGLLVMPLEDIMAKVEAALLQQPAQRMTGRFDWSRFRLAYPQLVRDARFLELFSDATTAGESRSKRFDLRVTLSEMEPEDRQSLLEYELTGKLSQILDAAPDKFDVSESINALGLDSLMLTDLQIYIGRLLDITLPLIKLLKGPSISTLAAELLADMDGPDATSTPGEDVAEFTLANLDGVEVINPWLIRGSGNAGSRCRLICFHSMGVGASLFTSFLVNPPEGYDILAVQTPGRENRAHEPVMESVDELADQIVQYVQPYCDRSVVIWGHSFGGIMASEVVLRLRDRHQIEPVHFVVSGTMAPHLIRLWQNREGILKSMVADNSPEYLMSLTRYVDDPEFLKIILPRLRTDFPLLKNYRFKSFSPMDCPITAFAARQDDMVYTDEIREWSRHTKGGFDLIEVDGDHWFLNRNRDTIIATLQNIASRHQRIETGHLVWSPTA